MYEFFSCIMKSLCTRYIATHVIHVCSVAMLDIKILLDACLQWLPSRLV